MDATRQLTDDDRQLVEAVFTEHRKLIENVARLHAPSPQDVPDIVQMVGIRICRGLRNFRGESTITTWLHRVTINAARDYYQESVRRSERVREALETTPIPDQIIDPDAVLAESERRAVLYDGLDQLTADERDLVSDHLRPWGVLSHRKGQRFKARRRLRDLLANDPRMG